MATLDADWSKAVAEEVQREEDASDANVDAFHESDKSQILNNAIFGREVPRADGPFGGYTSDDLDAVIALHPRDAIAASWALSDRLSVKSALRRRDSETSRS